MEWLVQYIDGFYRRSEESLRTLLDGSPENSLFHCNMALVLMKLGRLEDARIEIERAMTVNSDHPGILRVAAAIYEAMEQPALVSDIVCRLLSLRPEDIYGQMRSHRVGDVKPEEISGVRPLRITYLMATTGITGGAKIIFEHVNRLIERGHTVYVVSYMGQPDWFPLGTRVIQVPKGLPLVAHIPACDIVIATFWTHASDALRVPGAIPLYFVQGDEALFDDSQVDPRLKAVADRSYRLPMVILTVSDAVRFILKAKYNRKSYVIPNAVDRTIFFPRPKTSGAVKKILVVGPDQLRFKGIPEIYRALEIVRERRESQGKGGFEVVRVSQAPQLYSPAVPVTWIQRPPQPELGRIYADSDIFVSGSYYEAFSLPPLEAMASGLAVVTTDNDGVMEYARDGYNCLMVPRGDVEAMARAIETLLEDEVLAQWLSKNGLDTAAQYNWDDIVDQLEGLLYQLASDVWPVVDYMWFEPMGVWQPNTFQL